MMMRMILFVIKTMSTTMVFIRPLISLEDHVLGRSRTHYAVARVELRLIEDLIEDGLALDDRSVGKLASMGRMLPNIRIIGDARSSNREAQGRNNDAGSFRADRASPPKRMVTGVC